MWSRPSGVVLPGEEGQRHEEGRRKIPEPDSAVSSPGSAAAQSTEGVIPELQSLGLFCSSSLQIFRRRSDSDLPRR